MCDMHKSQPRRVYPPTKIASRKVTSKTCSEIVEIIKNSPSFIDMVQMYIQHNEFGRKNAANTKSTSSNSTKEVEIEEVSNEDSSSSEEESKNNDINPPITLKDTYMQENLADENKHLLMNLFKFPSDDDNTLHRLHFELSQRLKDNDNNIEHNNHVNNSKVTCLITPEGQSSSSQKKQFKQVMKMIDSNTEDREEDNNEKFIHRLLHNVDNKFQHAFFNYVVKKVYYTKQSPVTSAKCWNDVSEAASLRWTQQKIIKKCLNLHFGHEITVTEKNLHLKMKGQLHTNNVPLLTQREMR